MLNLIKKLWKDESGISATEYGILAAIFAAAMITVMIAFRDKVSALYNGAGSEIDTIDTSGAGS